MGISEERVHPLPSTSTTSEEQRVWMDDNISHVMTSIFNEMEESMAREMRSFEMNTQQDNGMNELKKEVGSRQQYTKQQE